MSDKNETHTGRRAFIKATGALGVGTGVALTTGATAAAETEPEHGTASFDNIGAAVILNPGFSILRTINFPGGTDQHVQFIGPNILAPLNGARHTALDFGKSDNAGFVSYHIRIRNDGAVAATHNMEGGGLT